MSRFACLRRLGALALGASTALAAAPPAAAAEREWLKLQAPMFGVISQLDERETLEWAVELDRFIGALHALYSVDGVALPPLTIVLFRQARDFAPYRLRTDSGPARVAAFFGNTGDWSIIGMPGNGRDEATRETIYHEAVHWFMTASDSPQPLWFAEGLAETLSTFEIVDGKGRWGKPLEDNVATLAYEGLLPMEDVLGASQDDALHGRESGRYYPQAWAFVHRMMFGNGGADSGKLATLLHELRTKDLDAAVASAFGSSYDALTGDLRRYLDGGRYGYAVTPLRERSGELRAEPASETSVELALGRLATVGGNLDLAREHAARVVALAPRAPSGYELTAYAAHEVGDEAALAAALERASELGSRESWIYATKADRLLTRHQRDSGHLDELLAADVARTAADLYERALALRPRNLDAFSGLVMALLNVDAPTQADSAALEAGRVLFPTDGVLLVGQAAAVKSRGDVREAARLLAQAAAKPFSLPKRYRAPVAALRNCWLGDWYLAELAELAKDARFDESRKFVAEQLADETITGPLRRMLESVADDLPPVLQRRPAPRAEAPQKGYD